MERARRLVIPALIIVAGAGAVAGARALWNGAKRADAPREVSVLDPGRVVVEVLNASGRRGLARVATRTLRASGFDVVYFGTSGDSLATTEVVVRRGDSAAAIRVIRALGTGRVRMAIDTLLRLDLSVRLGRDYKPEPGLRP
ncbi:MAG: LytR C-terminal domain-containing protein [Gemmatimonadales bacterium]|nr:LytR C-terminal domain-containing protein [Gemmatimonadales bacterium]